MKVVSPYEELKSWFSLENYEQLKITYNQRTAYRACL